MLWVLFRPCVGTSLDATAPTGSAPAVAVKGAPGASLGPRGAFAFSFAFSFSFAFACSSLGGVASRAEALPPRWFLLLDADAAGAGGAGDVTAPPAPRPWPGERRTASCWLVPSLRDDALWRRGEGEERGTNTWVVVPAPFPRPHACCTTVPAVPTTGGSVPWNARVPSGEAGVCVCMPRVPAPRLLLLTRGCTPAAKIFPLSTEREDGGPLAPRVEVDPNTQSADGASSGGGLPLVRRDPSSFPSNTSPRCSVAWVLEGEGTCRGALAPLSTPGTALGVPAQACSNSLGRRAWGDFLGSGSGRSQDTSV